MKIVKDIILLQVAKVLELIIPIIIIPIVILNIGLADFGVITKLIATSTYLVIFGEWGFNTNLVNYYKRSENSNSLLKVFMDVMKYKGAYSLVVITLLLALSFFNVFSVSLSIILSVLVISNTFQCRWYFQAADKLVPYTLYTIIVKSTLLYYAFFMMDESSTKEGYLFAYIFPIFIIAIASTIYTYLDISSKATSCDDVEIFKYGFTKDFVSLFIEGWNLISSRIISKMFSPVMMYLAGFNYGNEIVGLIGIYQKVVSGVVAIFTPINEVVYPKLAGLYDSNYREYTRFLTLQVISIVLMYFVFITLSLIVQDYLFDYLNIEQSKTNVNFYYIYSLCIISNLVIMAVVNALVIKGTTRQISKISTVSVLSALAVFLFIHNYTMIDHLSVAIVFVMQQLLSLIMMSAYYLKK